MFDSNLINCYFSLYIYKIFFIVTQFKFISFDYIYKHKLIGNIIKFCHNYNYTPQS
jgi:hypothetical protein